MDSISQVHIQMYAHIIDTSVNTVVKIFDSYIIAFVDVDCDYRCAKVVPIYLHVQQ